MRAVVPPACSPASTIRRGQRAVTGAAVVVVMPSALPVTVAKVVQVVPSVLVCRRYARVFQAAVSPPADACRTTTVRTVTAAPRSTDQVPPPTPVHHLLLADATPSSAWAASSAAAHAV